MDAGHDHRGRRRKIDTKEAVGFFRVGRPVVDGGCMWLLLIPLKLRYLLLSVALAGLAASAVLAWWFSDHLALLAILLIFFGFFSLLGLRDFFQPLRNYPITAHLRFLFEKIRLEMRRGPTASRLRPSPPSRRSRRPPSSKAGVPDCCARCANHRVDDGRVLRHLPRGSIHPPPAPFGDGERINLSPRPRHWRTGRQGRHRSPPFADREVLSCAISAMRKPWRIPCAMP